MKTKKKKPVEPEKKKELTDVELISHMKRYTNLTDQYLHWAMIACLKAMFPNDSKVTVVYDLDRMQSTTSWE